MPSSNTSRRQRADRRFRIYGQAALLFSALFLLFFFYRIIGDGIQGFMTWEVQAEISYKQQVADGSYRHAVDRSLRKIVSRSWLRTLPLKLEEQPEKIGSKETLWLPLDTRALQYIKGMGSSRLKEKTLAKIEKMKTEGKIRKTFNSHFLSHGDSKNPEIAGVGAALVGSILVMLICMLIAVPLGVVSAVYLEEFSKDNWITQMIETNINNLAAIPSVLFGLLGLAIFINIFGVPRSSALAGGMTLALMTLPVIIISTRAALRSVPLSIRQAAWAVGASPLQTVWHHVLPLAMPGILTGSIIGLAQALGETAPLLIVGMMAYIPDLSFNPLQASTVLPAQIYTWSGESLRLYTELTAAGIIVLIVVMLTLNAFAVWLRQRTQKTW